MLATSLLLLSLALPLVASTTSPPSETDYSPYLPPGDLEVIRLNDTSVVLKWDLTYIAHEHLQFFKIQYKSTRKDADWKTDNREIPPTTKAYQINGLRPGNYFFIVSAVYDNDDNVQSEQFKYRLKARSKISDQEMPEQKAPVIHWSHAESDFFRFKWTYKPKEKDVPYFGYLVYFRSTHAVTDFTIYSTLDENVEIAEVEPETPYEAKVVAYNQHGVSEFSDLIRIKTLPKPAHPTQNSTISTTEVSVDSISSTTPYPQTTTTSLVTAATSPHTTTTTSPDTTTTTTTTTTSLFNNTSFPIRSVFHSPDDFTLLVFFCTISAAICLTATLCLISTIRRKKSPPPSITLDLEINSYFKKSFPGL